jgi:hypothetical protein
MPKTVEELWFEYASQCITLKAGTDDQRHELRMSFYAGCRAMLEAAEGIGPLQIGHWWAELDDFADDQIQAT